MRIVRHKHTAPQCAECGEMLAVIDVAQKGKTLFQTVVEQGYIRYEHSTCYYRKKCSQDGLRAKDDLVVETLQSC